VGADEGDIAFAGEEDLPGLDDEGAGFGEGGVVGGGRDLYSDELTSDADGGEVEGEELVYVVAVLKVGFGVEVDVSQEVVDGILELLVELFAKFALHDGDDLVILFHPERDFADLADPVSVRAPFVLRDGLQDVIDAGRECEWRGELVQ
jgi:hypothetical protein